MEEKPKLDMVLEKLGKLEEDAEERKKKPMKIPIFKRVMGKKARDNYVTIIKLSENGQISFEKEKIVEQTTMIDGVPRLASVEHVFHYKRNPVIIQPSWSVEPFSPNKNYEETLATGSNITGYRLLMNRMQTETVKLEKKIGGWGLSIGAIVIIGIIIYALVTG